MTDIDVEWEGDSPEDMARELAKLESIVMDYLEEAMETAVFLIESTAKQLVPVDTGRLRSSIASEVEQVASNVVVGYIGSNVEYAPYVELGTSKMDAQPYLGPAIETHIHDIERLLKEAINDAVDEIS